MPCNECGCKNAPDQTLAEETKNLTLTDRKEACSCRAQAPVKSCCSSNSDSRPSRGCSCCCRSCCACCRCCSRSSRDFCQDRINEAKTAGCKCCSGRREEVVTPACSCRQ